MAKGQERFAVFSCASVARRQLAVWPGEFLASASRCAARSCIKGPTYSGGPWHDGCSTCCWKRKTSSPLVPRRSPMLVLTRKAQEQIQIGHNIKVTVVRVKGRSVRLGIEAPDNVRIVRGELAAAMAEFRDDDTMAENGDFAAGDLDESDHEPSDAMLPADDEDETPSRSPSPSPSHAPTPATAPSTSRPPPFGRPPGDRRCQLRRPPRLGPAAFRSLSRCPAR